MTVLYAPITILPLSLCDNVWGSRLPGCVKERLDCREVMSCQCGVFAPTNHRRAPPDWYAQDFQRKDRASTSVCLVPNQSTSSTEKGRRSIPATVSVLHSEGSSGLVSNPPPSNYQPYGGRQPCGLYSTWSATVVRQKVPGASVLFSGVPSVIELGT